MNPDEEHLRLLGIFHYVLGGLMALGACIPIIHFIIGVAMVAAPQQLGAPGKPVPVLVGWIFMAVAATIILVGWLVAALVLWSGRCLQQRQRYTFSFVMACIQCAFFPLGTTLGVFTLIVLQRPSVKALYSMAPPAG